MKTLELMGFPTNNKVPIFPWRNPLHRRTLEHIFKSYDQAGVVPAEHGCVVIDIDNKNGVNGKDSLFGHFEKVPESMNYRTKNGGFHLWYSVPSGTTIPQENGKLPGVDVRYSDGYVCIGRDYLIRHDGEILECPPDILSWLQTPKRRKVDYSEEQANNAGGSGSRHRFQYNLSPIPRGRRNDTLYRWGCGLLCEVRSGGMTMTRLSELVHMRGANSGMTYGEVEKIIESLLHKVG